MKNYRLFLAILFGFVLSIQVTAQKEPDSLPCGVPFEASEEAEPLYPMPFEGKWGFVDRRGEWVIQPTWQRVTDFSEGRAVVAEVDGYWGVIDRSGEYVLEAYIPSAVYTTVEGLRVSEPPLEPYSEGCSAGVGQNPGALPFFVDREGNIHWADTHPAQLAELDVRQFGSFSEGKAWFKIFAMGTDLEYGWIDASGNIVLPVEYAGAGEFVEGLAPAASEEDNWGYIDGQGELVLPRKWTLASAWPFSEGLARVHVDTFKDAYFDSDGLAFDSVTLTGERRTELGETLELGSGGAFEDGLAPVSVESPEGRFIAYVNADGAVAFVPDDTPGVNVCHIFRLHDLPEFRNGLVRLAVANEGGECGGAPVRAEFSSFQGVHYVYLGTSGELVLDQHEIEPPPLPESEG